MCCISTCMLKARSILVPSNHFAECVRVQTLRSGHSGNELLYEGMAMHQPLICCSCTSQVSAGPASAAIRPSTARSQRHALCTGAWNMRCGTGQLDGRLRQVSLRTAGLPAPQRRSIAAAAQQDQQPLQVDESSPEKPSYSEGAFLLRLLAVSFAGAGVVKYGELLLGNIPFSHNLGLALAMVFGPCIVYSIILATRSKG